jgi:hypothetical protein
MMAGNSIFVIPHNNGSLIACLTGTGISEIGKLDVPYHTPVKNITTISIM